MPSESSQSEGRADLLPPGFEWHAIFKVRSICSIRLTVLPGIRRSQAIAMQCLVSQVLEAGNTDWRAAAWMLERRFPEDFAKPQQIEHSGPGGKPMLPSIYPEHEVLQRIKKQAKMVDFAGKLGAILAKNRLERFSNKDA